MNERLEQYFEKGKKLGFETGSNFGTDILETGLTSVVKRLYKNALNKDEWEKLGAGRFAGTVYTLGGTWGVFEGLSCIGPDVIDIKVS
jgi:hypothetical protein